MFKVKTAADEISLTFLLRPVVVVACNEESKVFIDFINKLILNADTYNKKLNVVKVLKEIGGIENLKKAYTYSFASK